MVSQISFDLENSSAETDVVVNLIPAMLKRAGSLAGKFLKGTDFKDASGATKINVSGEQPEGAIAEFNEYAAQLTNIKVLGIIVGTSNLAQATQHFLNKTHVEYKPAIVANIDEQTSLTPGKSEVTHTFAQPWSTGAMKTLQMNLLKGEKVSVTLILDMPDFTNTAEVQAAILPHQ